MKKYIFSLMAAILAVVSPTANAIAMAVTPIIINLVSIGRNSRADISVTNTASGTVPVAVTINEAIISPNGEITQKPVDDLFLVYPAQALIKAGATQRFRVQWAGDPELAKSRTFIFAVAQQPVALPEGQSGIQILYNFEVIVSVAPEKAKPELSIVDAKFATIEGKKHAEVTISNNGAAHGYLSGSKLKLEAKDAKNQTIWTKSYDSEELGQAIGAGILQPNSTRKFVLPFDLPEGGVNLTASIKYVGRK